MTSLKGPSCALALSLSLVACDSLSSDGKLPPKIPAVVCDGPPPATPSCGRVGEVVQLWGMPHPGRGSEVVVRMLDACGFGVLASDYHSCLSGSGGAATAPRELPPGYVMILAARPRDDAESAAIRAAIDALAEARPATEAIALHRWGETVEQLTDFTRDRVRLRHLAETELAGTSDAAPLDVASALEGARRAVETVGGGGELVLRAVILVGGEQPAVAAGPSIVEWLSAGDAGGVAELSARLDAASRAGAAGIGVCGASSLEVEYGAGHTDTLALPAPLPEEDRLTCDAEAAARGERPHPRRIEFVFTPEERDRFDDMMSRRSRRDFDLHVRLGDAEPIPATAHLRGHGSAHCERKPFSVNLEAMGPRPITAGAMTDEFFLLSLCWDQGYVENYTYNQIASALDYYPMRFDYVELVIDGESRGVYLLVEKPHEAMKQDHTQALGVIRRHHEIDGDPVVVKLFGEGNEWIVDAYDDLLSIARSTSGDEMIAALRERMAFDHYLRFVAVMSALRNSDYGDEVRFLATARPGTPGASFEISAWDLEDLLRLDCVWEAYTLYDPSHLVYCAEGWLEQAVLDDPVAHELYAEKLGEVLDTLTEETFEAALMRTRERLLPLFDSAEVRAASIEMDPPRTLESITARIDSRLRTMRSRFHTRRTEMRRLLDEYLAGP